jgi:hypothetical protein
MHSDSSLHSCVCRELLPSQGKEFFSVVGSVMKQAGEDDLDQAAAILKGAFGFFATSSVF